jgi:ABC-type proline/glycine betaine transport system substrate-binding protein
MRVACAEDDAGELADIKMGGSGWAGLTVTTAIFNIIGHQLQLRRR